MMIHYKSPDTAPISRETKYAEVRGGGEHTRRSDRLVKKGSNQPRILCFRSSVRGAFQPTLSLFKI